MRLHRAALATLLFGILVASCGGDPGLTVTIANQSVPTEFSSRSTRTACSGVHGDGPAPSFVPTTVRASIPLSIRLEAGPGTTEIRGWIYELDASGQVRGNPIEQFSLPSRSGSVESRTMVAGHSYQVTVNATWSALISQGAETRTFRLAVAAP